MQRRHIVLFASAAVGAAVAVTYEVQLLAYGVPASLAVSCSLAVFASAFWLAGFLGDVLTATTHRCQAPGCDFRARVRGVDAAENRRWQEAAAEHPHHRIDR